MAKPPQIGKLSRLHLYIDEHMEAKDKSPSDMAEALETNLTTVWRWRTGKQRPSNHDIARIASFLECERVEDLYSPPGRPSIDAQLRDAPDEIYRHIFDIAVAAKKLRK